MLTEDHTTPGIYRDNPVSLRLEIARYDMGGFSLIGRGSHERDSLCLLVDAQ